MNLEGTNLIKFMIWDKTGRRTRHIESFTDEKDALERRDRFLRELKEGATAKDMRLFWDYILVNCAEVVTAIVTIDFGGRSESTPVEV